MNTNRRHPLALGLTLLTLFCARGAQAAVLPAETCTSSAPGTRTCNLRATVDSLALPGGVSVPVWTYGLSGEPASLPGPVLIVHQGETITVNLTNELSEPTALLFHGQTMAPDLTGAPAGGGTASYTFVASAPGTFLYEAGLLPNAQHQVAMGLYGVLIVRPPQLNQANLEASSTFEDEAVVVLSELDPALNTSANPAGFDMRDFAPKYFLLNGKAYPQTDLIPTAAGNRVLLRYANAGLQAHAMALLGVDQAVLAVDGNVKPFAGRVVAESIGTGQTVDAIATVPTAAAAGSRFALYDASFSLHNNGAAGFGGMLTFLSTGPAGGGGSTAPQTTAVTLSPNPTTGAAGAFVTAAISAPGGTVAGAEYFLDLEGPPGSGTPMAATDGAFGSTSEAVSAAISAPTLAALAAGSHVVYVRGQDATGQWGPVNFGVLNLDKEGPMTSAVMLAPNPASGAEDVMLSATGDDRATGGSLVSAAEYFVDAAGAPGTGTPMAINVSATEVSLTAALPAASIAALVEGDHLVAVRSQDALGTWGGLALATLRVDRTGPATVGFTATPNPNDGTMPINASTAVVRLTATFDDLSTGGAVIRGGEAFLDAVGVTGTGLVFLPADGLFNGASEAAFTDIPLATIGLLSVGPHTLYAHARDAAGNWGPITSLIFTIDKTAPAVSGFAVAPNPTNAGASNNLSFTLSAAASDVGLGGSTIVRAEWFEGTDPGAGNGTAMLPADGAFNGPSEQLTATINFVALGWAAGNHTLGVRARDAANNWSAPITGTVNVVRPNTVFADGFEAGNYAGWSGGPTGSAGLAVTAGAALQGSFGLQATLNGNAPRYLTDLSPLAEPSYHGRFYFNPNGANPGNSNQTIFSGRTGAGLELFRVELRRQGGAYRVRGWVRTPGGIVTTAFVTIANAVSHPIEIAWAAANPAVFDFYVDGTLRQRLSGLNTNAYRLESVRLGPSAGLPGSASGVEYFDAFVSTRRTVVGP